MDYKPGDILLCVNNYVIFRKGEKYLITDVFPKTIEVDSDGRLVIFGKDEISEWFETKWDKRKRIIEEL